MFPNFNSISLSSSLTFYSLHIPTLFLYCISVIKPLFIQTQALVCPSTLNTLDHLFLVHIWISPITIILSANSILFIHSSRIYHVCPYNLGKPIIKMISTPQCAPKSCCRKNRINHHNSLN